MSVLARNNVHVAGNPTGKPIMFAHGYGCDQQMWRYVTPAFEDEHKVVLFDHVGYGDSEQSAWSAAKYSSLQAYADDALEICRELDLQDVVFVGHSVSSMIGALMSKQEPDRFKALVMVGPSPRYIDDENYVGGFTERDVEELLTSLESNYLGWSAAMAPAIMGNPDRPELGEELTQSFCRTSPDIAAHFARVTFLSDNRQDLAEIKTPTLVLQCSADAIAPESVGYYVAERIPHSSFVMMEATGHCPNLSAPDETVGAIKAFLAELP